jgi:hypothetical protein
MLQSIDCTQTQVDDLAPLKGLPALETIDCSTVVVALAAATAAA